MSKKSFGELPLDIKLLLFSDELSETVTRVCFEIGVENPEKNEKVGRQVAKVLVGRLPPENLIQELKKELKLSPMVVVKIANEINRRIFSAVRNSLTILYKKKEEVSPPEKPPMIGKSEKPLKEQKEQKEQKPSKEPDVYREPIE